MSRYDNYDPDLIETPHRRAPRRQGSPKLAVPKHSYESNADVQRWLEAQALTDGSREAFNPTFLAGLRDRLWILSSLAHFYDKGLIDDVVQVVKSGKEATVYCCTGGPALDMPLLAAKIYRPRMFRSLRNDAIYRDNRAQHDEQGRVIRGGRQQRERTVNERSRAARVMSWIEHEFRVLEQVHLAGAAVPQPVAQIGNALLMEYVGEPGRAAPLLREVRLEQAAARQMWDGLVDDIGRCLTQHCIHGDLSAYNILYRHGKAVIIDFAQAVDPRHNPEVYTLLERDLRRSYEYFARFGVQADPSAITRDLWNRYQNGTLAG